MKSIFAQFDNYEDAQKAVDALVEEGFDEASMNAIVREQMAKRRLDVNLHEVDVMKSDAVGADTARGLTRLLGGQQPVPLPGVGEVLAGGNLATNVAQAASASGATDVGLKEALAKMGVPEETAESYRAAVEGGGVLFWIRVEDERAAEAANLLRAENGRQVSDYAGNAPIR